MWAKHLNARFRRVMGRSRTVTFLRLKLRRWRRGSRPNRWPTHLSWYFVPWEPRFKHFGLSQIADPHPFSAPERLPRLDFVANDSKWLQKSSVRLFSWGMTYLSRSQAAEPKGLNIDQH
jgi:hypothetical protein